MWNMDMWLHHAISVGPCGPDNRYPFLFQAEVYSSCMIYTILYLCILHRLAESGDKRIGQISCLKQRKKEIYVLSRDPGLLDADLC